MTRLNARVRGVIRDPFRGYSNLTDRQREVAILAAQGLTRNEIADRLQISSAMAGQHLRFAMEKMGVRRKRELTQLMLREAFTTEA